MYPADRSRVCPLPGPLQKIRKIFIFDDSFSALDYKTDMVLRKSFTEKATKDATLIIVAQRISTILHANQIIVLDEERWRYREPIKNC